MWNPALYRLYAGERSRPFFDLVGRVGTDNPGRVVDLGCGPGELTTALATRWPEAEVTGIDNSEQMIDAARRMLADRGVAGTGVGGQAGEQAGEQAGSGCGGRPGRLSFALGDVRTWRPGAPPDVIVCNAVLQWVPDHGALLTRWAGSLAAGGWLALQMPANDDAPAYRLLRELIAAPRWRNELGGVELAIQRADPAGYLDLLAAAGCEVDAWETTYVHVLQGEDPVLRWYSSTGLRPVLTALDPARTHEFLGEYGALLRAAYPARPYGTAFGFRRVFAVARRR